MELFVFSTNLTFSLTAEKSGIDSIIVDWEHQDKSQRQKGYNCQINRDTPEDAQHLFKSLRIPITVRINSVSENTSVEITSALSHGASIIMLPMARSAQEVENFLHLLDNRAKSIIQIETWNLIQDLDAFVKLPWDYSYVGLNDLMIARQGPSIWKPLKDGTVEKICAALKGRKYGFGGVTVLGGGDPIKIELLLHEYTRLGCSLGLVRRSFFKEVLDRNLETEIPLIKQFLENSRCRGPQAIESDHRKLMEQIHD